MPHDTCTLTMQRRLTAGIAITSVAFALGVFAPHAAAASTWSRNPDSSLAGGRVRVASSAETLCQWVQPGEPSAPDTSPTTVADPTPTSTTTASGDVTYDGVRVELRLEPPGGGTAVALGSVNVTSGGAWSGTVTIPAAEVAPPGEYDLLAHCVVDHPQLDGVRSFDFDPLSLTIVEGPPPTTTTIPTELIPPITVTNPVQVEGEQINRPAATPSSSPPSAKAATAVPTLPKTGDGTLAVALAGLGALLLGAGALWYGNRQNLRHPDIG
ncbi:MAG: LPXTG cell wall anchor domain-containing protein [Acidimicrobiia bacterium]